jgi:hypothetical protein
MIEQKGSSEPSSERKAEVGIFSLSEEFIFLLGKRKCLFVTGGLKKNLRSGFFCSKANPFYKSNFERTIF